MPKIKAALVLFGVLALHSASAGADAAEDLRGLVDAQAKVISELQGELRSVRDEQLRSGDRLRALEEDGEKATQSNGVGGDYVDRRIEAFEDSPLSRVLLSGYGTSTFRDEEGSASTFDVSFNPGFHFRLTDKLHFNAELEFEYEEEDGVSQLDIGLEYAHIDYLATDWMTLSGGKFLIPFNQFGPRLHPSWINRMASKPLLYGGHDGGGIIPVLSDAGVMASGGTGLWGDDSKWNYAVYVVNGPRLDEAEHDEDGEHGGPDDPLAFNFQNIPDENNSKSAGGRVGFLPIPNLEIGASYMGGKSKGEGGRFDLFGFDASYWWRGLELRGEYIRLTRDESRSNPNRWGYYFQAAYRLRDIVNESPKLPLFLAKFEPVLRWGEVRGSAGGDRQQLAMGLNYWLYESVPLKLTYELNSGDVDADRLFLQLAFGF